MFPSLQLKEVCELNVFISPFYTRVCTVTKLEAIVKKNMTAISTSIDCPDNYINFNDIQR